MTTTKKVFLISTICLYAFAVFGQWLIVMIYHLDAYAEQADMRLGTLAITALCVGAVRLFHRGGRTGRFWGLVYGVILTAGILFFAGNSLFHIRDKADRYHVSGWVGERYCDAGTRSDMDWQAERGKLWRLSHWFGRGEPWYPYDDAVLRSAPEDVDWAAEEPYRSELDKMARVNHIIWSGGADMLLNLLCCRLGRWVWCVYCLIALTWTGSGIALLFGLASRRALLSAVPALGLLAIQLWLPTLSCLGLIYSYHGLLFTAASGDTMRLHYRAAAPALGLLLGLTLGEGEKKLLDRIAEKLKQVF